MDKQAQNFISEAAKYGIAMMVFSIVLLAAGLCIYALWKHQVKREEKLFEIINENTKAFQQLQGTINILISKL